MSEHLDREGREELARKNRAIACRTVRLFVAANPGLTGREIFERTGIHSNILMALLRKNLVRFTHEKEGDSRRARWYVVPQ